MLALEVAGGEALATSVTRAEAGDVAPPAEPFTLDVDGEGVVFVPEAPSTYRIEGPEPAIDALAAAGSLLIATDAEGKLWGAPGRVAAVHAVIDGRCRVPFSVTGTGGRANLAPSHACTEHFTVAALGSAIDDPAVRGSWTGQPHAAVSGQTWHRRTALMPGRTVVSYDPAGVGSFRLALGPDRGTAPAAQRFHIDQASAVRLLGAPPGRITDASRPLVAYHAEHAIGYDPEGALIIPTDRPDPFELDAPDQVCFDDPHGSSVGGVGPDAPGPKAVAATRVTDPYGVSRTTFYDAAGRLLRSVNDATGATFNYTRDARGQVLGVEGPLGARVCNDYGPRGELVQTTAYPAPGAPGDARMEQRWLTWQESPLRLRKVSAIGDPTSTVVEHHYDGDGNLERTDRAGEHVIYQVDGRGAVTKTIDESGVETDFIWDPATGLVATRTEDATGPKPSKTTWTWDRVGKLSNVSEPSGLVTTHTYQGQRPHTVTREADGIAKTANFTYDGDGQLTGVDTPLVETTADYDLTGHRIWRIDRAKDGSVEERRRCADVGPGGRMLEQVAPNGLRTRYNYDEEGRVRQVVAGMWPDSPQSWDDLCPQIPGLHPEEEHVLTVMAYDLAGKATSVTDARGEETTYRHDGHGRLIETTTADGTVTRKGYDDQGRSAWTAVYDASGATLPWGAPVMGQPACRQ